MKISLNAIKNYVNVPQEVSDEELISLIGSRLVEIEETIDLAPKYRGAYIVKVVSCEPIPETHLNLCQIDAGDCGVDCRRLDNGLIQVVCGAPNVHAGMLAVWLSPGSIVPETYGNENFRLSVRKLRGYESNGMLAGADELDLDDEHKAIAEIDPKDAQPGDAFADAFGLNDIILDVENKSLTHRPDCFGLIGFAREVAGVLGVPFVEPEPFTSVTSATGVGASAAGNANTPKVAQESQAVQNTVKLDVKITDAKLCPRYSAAVFDLPNHRPSKYLTQSAVFLAKAGMRAIDPMVDLTNVLMLETGQPLHAFDYDKLVAVGGTQNPQIIVRAARAGEELQLLDGKTIQCIEDDILITSNNVPVALAGAMGGKNTEIDASTQRVVLESATFSLYNLRKTQMAHGIFSEAITRFTKGQPAAMTLPVLSEAVRRLGVETLAVADDYPENGGKSVVKITTLAINQLLGSSYDAGTIIRTLENVGFGVKSTGHGEEVSLEVTVPAWRTDIHIAEDITEEVGRLLGYDNIPLTLPRRPMIPPEVDPLLRLKSELRNILSNRLGMNELITYSFVSKQLMAKALKDPEDCYEIVNSISPELQCFRSEIVPSLLDKARENLKAGHRDFTLYEMNQVSRKSSGLTPEKTPVTKPHLGIVGTSDFYGLKAQLLELFKRLKLPFEYGALSAGAAQNHPYLEPKRSAEIFLNGERIGAFGEVRARVLAQFKLERTMVALELGLDDLADAPRVRQTAIRLSKFPPVERDLTLRVASDTPFGRVLKAIDAALAQQELYYTVTPVSIYQAQPTDATKNLSFHLKFAHPTQTLNAAEISAIMDKITRDTATLGASVV